MLTFGWTLASLIPLLVQLLSDVRIMSHCSILEWSITYIFFSIVGPLSPYFTRTIYGVALRRHFNNIAHLHRIDSIYANYCCYFYHFRPYTTTRIMIIMNRIEIEGIGFINRFYWDRTSAAGDNLATATIFTYRWIISSKPAFTLLQPPKSEAPQPLRTFSRVWKDNIRHECE